MKPISLATIQTKKKNSAARDLRADLFQRCRAAIDQMGDNIAGFALVVWDHEGDLRSAYNAQQGPIGPALMPTLVADALNRHVAVMLAAKRAEDE